MFIRNIWNPLAVSFYNSVKYQRKKFVSWFDAQIKHFSALLGRSRAPVDKFFAVGRRA